MCHIAVIIYLFLVLLFCGFTLNAYHSMALYCVIKRYIQHEGDTFFTQIEYCVDYHLAY